MEDDSLQSSSKQSVSRNDCEVDTISVLDCNKDDEKNPYDESNQFLNQLPFENSEILKSKSDYVQKKLKPNGKLQRWNGNKSDSYVPLTGECRKMHERTKTCIVFERDNKMRRKKVKTNIKQQTNLSTDGKKMQSIKDTAVKIDRKLSSDSDEEVEIEVEIPSNDSDNQDSKVVNKLEYKDSDSTIDNSFEKEQLETMSEIHSHSNDSSCLDQLSSLDTPKNESLLRENFLNDLEKIVYKDLLSPMEDVTQRIYLDLRNHIISKWRCKKPNYVTKTDIRKDHNKSYDKRILDKMHSFLEQIGAINFGCNKVKYMRPMQKFIDCLCMKNQESVQSKRHRKKKFLNNGEGGCTVSHGVNGEIIDTMIINEDQPHPKKRVRKKPIYLIYCQPSTQRNGYQLQLHISALLLMDFHAHSSLSEVMGLIGGSWCYETKKFTIKHYEQCKNAASSITHCDMCPISQAASAERIHNLNMDLLGWFHSHPMFPPEPSQQDLDTQQDFQDCIGYDKPVIGIILAPFYRRDVLFPSDYRCLIVEKSKTDCGYVPYKLKVDIHCNDFNIDKFLENMSKIYQTTSNKNENKVDFNFGNPYIHDTSITYMDKFISSARMTLDKYVSDVAVRTRILNGIQDIVNTTQK